MKNCTISFYIRIFVSFLLHNFILCPISFKSQSIALYYKKWFVELQFEKRVEIIIFILQVPLVRIADLLHTKIVVLLGIIRCPNELGFVVTSQCQLFETERNVSSTQHFAMWKKCLGTSLKSGKHEKCPYERVYYCVLYVYF